MGEILISNEPDPLRRDTGSPSSSPGELRFLRNVTGSSSESEVVFRKIFETSPIGIALVSPDLRFFAANPAWIAMTGYPEEELVRLTVKDITHPDHLAGDLEHIRDLIAKKIPVYQTEKRYIRKDKSILWGHLRVTAYHDEDGVFRYLVAQIEDITERKRAEDALKESEIRFREQYRSNPLAIFTWQRQNDDFVLIDCNLAAETLTSGRARELIGKRASDLYSSREEILALVQQCYTEHSMKSMEIVSENFLPGKKVFTIAAFVPPDLIMVHMEDVTGRRAAEEALREKTALMEAQLHSSEDGILVVDAAGKKTLQNERLVTLWKIPRDVADNPDDAQQVRHVMHMTKNPEEFVEKVMYLYSHPSETSHDFVELIDGTVLERYSSPVLGKDGRNYGRIWNFRDITERRRAEAVREKLIAELASKNRELDRFTYTVSHDLKSPLIAIRAFLSILGDDLKAGDTRQAADDLQLICESAEKLENMIQSLLTLSRSGKAVSTPVPVSLAHVVAEAASLLEPVIKERQITLTIRENLPVVMGDRQRLLQVITNLLDNAIKFMGGQEHPAIEIGMQEMDDRAVFFVRDNGTGIRREDLPRLFGLYERLDPDVPGTGIGLATVKRIIEAHGGRIWVESDGPGRGSVFRFTLPGVTEGSTDTNNNR